MFPFYTITRIGRPVTVTGYGPLSKRFFTVKDNESDQEYLVFEHGRYMVSGESPKDLMEIPKEKK